MGRKPSRGTLESVPRPPFAFLDEKAKWISGFADATAASSVLTDTERSDLVHWQRTLNNSVRRLIEIFTAHDALRPWEPNGSADVWEAIVAAFFIGAKATKNPIYERILRQARKARTLRATGSKLSRSRAIDDVISSLAMPILQKYPRRSANWVAGSVELGVNARLKALNLRSMKIDAIRKRVRKIRTNARSST